jgi:dephospho-CoA kinase
LTGGLGAGKSTALAGLERLGAAVLSTDAVVHELYETDAVRDAVRARLGAEVVRDGRVDRAAVARKVFADEADRRWLEGLLWPLVAERVAAFRAAAGARIPVPPVVVIETPLLFEAGLADAYDATIAVVADDGLRETRAGGRGHEAIAERERRQLSQEEKARRATHVVHNSGSLEELEHRLGEVLAQLGR